MIVQRPFIGRLKPFCSKVSIQNCFTHEQPSTIFLVSLCNYLDFSKLLNLFGPVVDNAFMWQLCVGSSLIASLMLSSERVIWVSPLH